MSKKSGKWKLNKVYIWCLRYSFEFFFKTGVGVCNPCVVFSLSRPTNQSLQHCQKSPFPQKLKGLMVPGVGGVPLFPQTPPVMAQLVKQSVVKREEHIWLGLCSLFQMWTNVSCSVACAVKPSVKMWKGPSCVCALTKARSTAPWPGSAAPGSPQVSDAVCSEGFSQGPVPSGPKTLGVRKQWPNILSPCWKRSWSFQACLITGL